MASITIRNLEVELKRTLRVRAARHGRSMEEEVRQILREALALDANVRAVREADQRAAGDVLTMRAVKVDRGETRNDIDLYDLDEVFINAREVAPLVDRHPEWQALAIGPDSADTHMSLGD